MGVTQLCVWVSHWDQEVERTARYLRHATRGLQPPGEREIQFSQLDRSDAGATSPQGAQAGAVTWREVVSRAVWSRSELQPAI